MDWTTDRTVWGLAWLIAVFGWMRLADELKDANKKLDTLQDEMKLLREELAKLRR
jgi:hypothetical protein